MRILITGAPGSGTTTLAKSLCTKLDIEHLDVDDYYWVKTNPPFQKKISPIVRRRHLLDDFSKCEKVIVSGSLVSWGVEWLNVFDLVVFIQIDPDIRMKRLKEREFERYGSALETNDIIKKQSKDFLDWASKYDDPNFEGRSIKIQKDWLDQLTCPTLNIDGTLSIDDKIEIVSKKIRSICR